MKFLIVFSVLALCAINVNGTFSKHFNKGGSSASSDTVVSSGHGGGSAGGHGGGGLASLGKILAIPLGIKQKLLLSHQKKINQKFDKIIGTLSKFGSHGSSSGGGASGGEISSNGNGQIDCNGNGGGYAQTHSGIGLSSSGHYDSGVGQDYSQNYNENAVQSYHPQPATQTQYKEVPITVHLYQVDAQPQAPFVQQRYEPAPVVQQRYEPAPVVQQRYEPAPVFQQRYEPAPVFQQTYEPAPVVQQRYEPQVPSSNYGPPDYQPSAPIVEQQVIQEVGNTYLPPHRK